MNKARLTPLLAAALLWSCSQPQPVSPDEPEDPDALRDASMEAPDQPHHDDPSGELGEMSEMGEMGELDAPTDLPPVDPPDDMTPDAPPEDMATTPSPCAPPMPGLAADEPFRRQRSSLDLPDDHPELYAIHVVYVEPHDQSSPERLDEDGSLRRSITAWNTWFAARTGGRRLRIDTCDGVIDITHVKLPQPFTAAAMATGEGIAPAGPVYLRDRVEDALKETFSDPKKLYLVYYDGLAFGACGGAPHPPNLIGRFTVLYRGGLFNSSLLTAPAPRGSSQITVYSPSTVQLPSPPFAATLGAERVQVTARSGDRLTLAAPLSGDAPSGATLVPDSRIPDCRANPYSPNGVALGYSDYAGVHEVLHALGIVGREAPHHSTTAAPGHLAKSNAAGTADLMYQGTEAWGCVGFDDTDAQASPCQLDPAHENYWMLPTSSPAVDLAKSVFIDPLPADAELPPGW